MGDKGEDGRTDLEKGLEGGSRATIRGCVCL